MGLTRQHKNRGGVLVTGPEMARSPRLHAEVTARLKKRWSPEQISRSLQRDFPDHPEMQVSHETIYQALYVQGRANSAVNSPAAYAPAAPCAAPTAHPINAADAPPSPRNC